MYSEQKTEEVSSTEEQITSYHLKDLIRLSLLQGPHYAYNNLIYLLLLLDYYLSNAYH